MINTKISIKGPSFELFIWLSPRAGEIEQRESESREYISLDKWLISSLCEVLYLSVGSPLLDSYLTRLLFGGATEAFKGGGSLIPPGL